MSVKMQRQLKIHRDLVHWERLQCSEWSTLSSLPSRWHNTDHSLGYLELPKSPYFYRNHPRYYRNPHQIFWNSFQKERYNNVLVFYDGFIQISLCMCTVGMIYLYIYNMKPARPWMLAHLKIIWQFHQKVSRIFGPRYIGDDFFLGPNLVSFNRPVVPFFELSFLTREGTRLQDHLCALC